MDVDLPVWTIRPNWATGVLERLEWLTDVLTSDTGVEQRRSVRMSPRRSFEITVNPVRAVRTYLDLLTHRLGSATWLLPLWHDQGALTVEAAIGDEELAFDNLYREHIDGGMSLLYYDAFTWEVVGVGVQGAAGCTLSAPIAKAWPVGTQVFPLRRAMLQDSGSTIKALTSRVGESTLLFLVNEANDYPEMAGNAMMLYQGSPLLTLAPDRSQEITTEQTRMQDTQDNDTGLIYRTDSAGRAFAVQSHNWQIKGREAHADFRSFLYTLRGRQRMVWLPTFNDDLMIAKPVAANATKADIEAVGMSYVGSGGPIPGRATLWTGTEVLNIATIQPPGAPGQERLGLLTPTAGSYAPGASWAFLQAARLDQDQIELHHHTDSDGTMEVSAGFHTFFNVRDSSGSSFQPIPTSDQTVGQCGSPVGLNPCSWVPFNGVFLSITLSAPDPCNPGWNGDCYCAIHDVAPNGGVSVGLFHFPGSPGHYQIFEQFVDGSPVFRGQLLAELVVNNFNDWTATYYFPQAQFSSVYIKPSARYCGSVGKDEGRLLVTTGGRNGGASFGPMPAGGNYDINFG